MPHRTKPPTKLTVAKNRLKMREGRLPTTLGRCPRRRAQSGGGGGARTAPPSRRERGGSDMKRLTTVRLVETLSKAAAARRRGGAGKVRERCAQRASQAECCSTYNTRVHCAQHLLRQKFNKEACLAGKRGKLRSSRRRGGRTLAASGGRCGVVLQNVRAEREMHVSGAETHFCARPSAHNGPPSAHTRRCAPAGALRGVAARHSAARGDARAAQLRRLQDGHRQQQHGRKECMQRHCRSAANALTPAVACRVLPASDAAQRKAMSAPMREIKAAALALCRHQCSTRSRVHAAATLRPSAPAVSCHHHAPVEAAICRRILRHGAAQRARQRAAKHGIRHRSLAMSCMLSARWADTYCSLLAGYAPR
jgi:hypothetical protein